MLDYRRSQVDRPTADSDIYLQTGGSPRNDVLDSDKQEEADHKCLGITAIQASVTHNDAIGFHIPTVLFCRCATHLLCLFLSFFGWYGIRGLQASDNVEDGRKLYVQDYDLDTPCL